jgi:hypothetical protein
MGLLGIITEVTLKVEDDYDVQGTFSTVDIDNVEFDMFGEQGSTKPRLADWLQSEPYSRLLWWPQEGVDRVQVWRCARAAAKGLRKPHVQFDHPALEQDVINFFYTKVLPAVKKVAQNLPGWNEVDAFIDELAAKVQQAVAKALVAPITEPSEAEVGQAFQDLKAEVTAGRTGKPAETVYAVMVRTVIRLFMELETKTPFRDRWYDGIPDDNQVWDEKIPIRFTEVWVPIERSAQVMKELRALYLSLSPFKRGSFCVEIYAAPKSDFFLSPAFGGDMLRIDIFAFENGPEYDALDEFYEPFWQLLRDHGGRFHWGKRLSPPASSSGADYRAGYLGARRDDFMMWREELDPVGIFLTKYWKDHLGLEQPSMSLAAQ